MKKLFCMIVLIMFMISLLIGCNKETENISEHSSSNIENTININLEFNNDCIDSCTQYIIQSDNLYGRGYNYNKILGQDSDVFYENYIKIAENVIHIDACNGTLMYLTKDYKVYGIGNTQGGILQANQNVTEPILLFENCKFFSIGKNFALAIKNDNSLWFWGESKHGQGTIVKDVVYEPVKIADNVQFVKAFGYTSAWIDEYGSLYLCGDNSFNQIGNEEKGSGISSKYEDIVSTPFCALKNCISFDVTDNSVIYAKTQNGDEYIWGNYHSTVPNLRIKEMPPKTESTQLASGRIHHQYNNILEVPESLQTFYIDKDENGNESIISKRYSLDNNAEKKIVKSNIAPPFILSSLAGGALTISSVTDDCVYLVSYYERGDGLINNINTSVLYDHYAVPIYIKDSTHLALVVPNSQRELLLNTETGKTEDGEFLNDSNLDNKPAITEQEARKIALNELSKSKYKAFAQKEHSFSAVGVSTLEYKPQYQGDYFNSWVTKDYFNNNPSWIWTVKVGCDKDDLCDMIVYVNAADGNVLYVANSSD